ncbi:MAG: acyltransferase family protein [Mycobacterium sp.]|nr:acyltransferase family protein [Mycobacterium sp.]
MAGEKAKVIPLHPDSGRLGARGSQRAGSSRRHPSAGPAAPGAEEQIEAVIREFDQRRVAESAPGDLVARIAGLADFLRKRLTGDYTVDEFGFDPQYNDAVVLPVLRFFYDTWFRVEVSGVENIPTEGAALIVANHAGTLPFDGPMLSVAVRDHHPAHRDVRLLAADMLFDMPVLGPVARKAGHTMACNADANRLLTGGELTAVFPEGYKGLGKPFRDRYKLQRFGRGGFVSAALQAKAPIIPCSIVGSEEIYPMLADVKLLARVLGVPYFPITPLFPLAGPAGLVPLPSKWHIAFGAPIDTTGYDEHAADDPMVTFEITDQVRETIQQTLFSLLSQRRNTFLG